MAFQEDSIFWVEVEKVVPNPFQPRREFNEEKLAELADSIRMYGVLQPLTVTRKEVHNDDGSFRTQYELIAGERRWRASKKAGVAQVPVIIRSGDQTEQEKLELAIIENLQREDLNAVDRALAFKQLAESFNLSHAQVAKKVGRSREYVSNSIRLLALPNHMLDGLKRGDISEGHARTLLMLKDKPEEQEVVYREILLKKLSVREVERISRKIANDKVRKKEYKDTDAHLIEIEKEFTDTLGTRVQILKTDFGGKLTIDYFSDEDLDHLLAAMKKQHARVNTAAAMTAAAISEQAEQTGETVIREMDELSESIAALEAATGLRSEESSAVKTPDSDDSNRTPEQPNATATASEDSVHMKAESAERQETAVDDALETVSPTPNSVMADSESASEPTVNQIPTPTESVSVNTHHEANLENTPTPVDTPAPAPAVPAEKEGTTEHTNVEEPKLQQPHDHEPVTSDVASKPTSPPTPPQAEGSAEVSDNGEPPSSLRARLEAELARLDALEQTETEAVTGETEAPTTDATTSAQSEAVETPDAQTESSLAETESTTGEQSTKDDKDDNDDLYSIRNFTL